MALEGRYLDMNLIMTMAGKYSRFINEGYRLPKYLLPWGDKSILSEIITVLNINNNFDNIYLIANKCDEVYMPHVRKIIESIGIPHENLFLVSDTKGQAETAHHAITEICNRFGELKGNIVFHNIDTILYNRDIEKISDSLASSDGYIDVFESNNHAYSYVLSEDDKVRSIAEKIVISNSATSGMYAFSNMDEFCKFYNEDVIYISDIYKNMIENHAEIAISRLHSEEDTIVLGVPSDYLIKAYMLEQ